MESEWIDNHVPAFIKDIKEYLSNYGIPRIRITKVAINYHQIVTMTCDIIINYKWQIMNCRTVWKVHLVDKQWVIENFIRIMNCESRIAHSLALT